MTSSCSGPCGQSCAGFLPLIKVPVWVLVGVRCNYSQLIIENLAFSGDSESDWPRPRAPTAPWTLSQLLKKSHASITSSASSVVLDFHIKRCVPFLRLFIKWAPALCFRVTCLLNSLRQCFLISLMTHWIVDLWVCMRRGWISCNYRELWR